MIALMSALPLPAEAGVPDWVHLLPAGPDSFTMDGRSPYHLPDPQAVIAASGGAKLPIDENHSIDLAAPQGGRSPAMGHIVELQARETGIWGRPEWNGSGRALIEDRAYLGLS
ncbi:MAG: phage protease, partial [Gemmobacter sp.]|nr:phage protease [Gemmobacter sp.]